MELLHIGGFINGGGWNKDCCGSIGNRETWRLYIAVNMKVQWRDSNEGSVYMRCLSFMFLLNLLTIQVAGQ